MIGIGQSCFVIAEAGVNHNGKLDLAKKLVDVAVDANADAVKFQTYKSENLVIEKVAVADYARKNMSRNISQIEMVKSLELNYSDFKKIKSYCDGKDIIFLSTPHSFDAIDFLEDLVPSYKFGSGDITNIPTLKYAAKKMKPIILGTGMSTMREVKNAISAIKSEGNKQIIALHCTTSYPCPLNEVNLKAMQKMRDELNCLVGYSDHTLGITVPIAATAMGASVIEKHFTISKKLLGPDHKASLEPDELKKMIRAVRDTEKILGSYEKKPTKSEKKIMKSVRKSIVANQDISKGSIINRNMVAIKRPGTGLNPSYEDKIIGKTAKRNIKKDEIFNLKMVV